MAQRTLFQNTDDVFVGLDFHAEENLKESFEKARALTIELHDSGFSTARDASLGTVNALLAAMTGRCRRSAPPAEIEMTTDGSGDLIYRCKHKNPHSWPA